MSPPYHGCIYYIIAAEIFKSFEQEISWALYRSRRTGIEKYTTGALHGMGSKSPLLFCQKERHPVGVAFFWYCFDTIDVAFGGRRWRDLIYIFLPSGGEKLWSGRRQDRRYSCTSILAFRLQSYGPQPESEGFSHGLKKCPPDTFLPSLRSGRPFKSPPSAKKVHPEGVDFLCCAF